MELLGEAQLTHQLDQVGTLLATLAEALDAERQALAGHNSIALGTATQSKQQILDQLEPLASRLVAPQTSASIAALPAVSKAKVETHHKAVMTAARHAKDSNAVNGKIVTRSQQSLLELVHFMTGNTTAPTYSERGQVETGNAQGIHRVQV